MKAPNRSLSDKLKWGLSFANEITKAKWAVNFVKNAGPIGFGLGLGLDGLSYKSGSQMREDARNMGIFEFTQKYGDTIDPTNVLFWNPRAGEFVSSEINEKGETVNTPHSSSFATRMQKEIESPSR